MTDKRSKRRRSQGLADAAALEEQHLRSRWEATQNSLRERFDQPIERATVLTQRTLAWFPVRVWRHFLQHNGFLLAAGISYQALFAFFAAIYVAFATVGLWLGGSTQAIDAMIDLINSYVPGLIGPDGVFTTDQVQSVASESAGTLGVTGLIALGTVIWTAIGFVTFTRRGVRDIFGITPDRRNYFLLKSLDALAALAFGIALLLGSVAVSAGTWALDLIFGIFGWDTSSQWFNYGVRLSAILFSFVLNLFALAALFRFLTGTTLRWRRVWGGSILGGAAIALLQLGAGFLLLYTPSNPLLATFAFFVGLLLWFRLVGIVMLVAASWIAVATNDADVPLLHQSEAERLNAEHRALLTAAQVRLRTAEEALEHAPWWRRWRAEYDVRAARDELTQVEAAAPPPLKKTSLLE